jgi:hypothetical protein
MKVREYRKYVKPLAWRDGPQDLYPGKLHWMEGGTDMEGISLCFAFYYVNERQTFHPMEGMISHPYDEVLVFASLDRANIRNLGGSVSIALGSEDKVYEFDKPTVVCIPRGLPHGPVRVLSCEKPFVHYALSLTGTYAEERVDQDRRSDTDYAYLLKDFVFATSDEDKSEMGYAMALGPDGVAHPADAGVGPGNADSLLWMFGSDLENFEVNFTWGHYSRCGKWHRSGEAQTHPEEEAIFFVGLNPDDPFDFEAEIEQALGPDGERYVIGSPSVYCIPPNLQHLPVVVRWVDKPYGLVVVGLARDHASEWSMSVEEALHI